MNYMYQSFGFKSSNKFYDRCVMGYWNDPESAMKPLRYALTVQQGYQLVNILRSLE